MDIYNNPQPNWPGPIRRQMEAQATTSGSNRGPAWFACCTCRAVTISFMLYYFTLNVVVLVLVFINKDKIEEQPQFWWIVSLSGSVVNIIMSTLVLTGFLFSDLSSDRANIEPDKTTKPADEDRSGSQKTILTINSRPSTNVPTIDSNAPPVIDQATTAAAVAAANQTASQAVKSPAFFPKLTLSGSNSPPQNFQNLTPNSSSVMPTNYSNKARKSPRQPKSPTVKAVNSNQKRERISDPASDPARAKRKAANKQIGAKKKS